MIPNRVLYYGQPVNRNHHLIRGLSSWWLPLPWYSSGQRLMDIAARSHGTIDRTVASWTRTTTGFGALDFRGTSGDQPISVSTPTASTSTQQATIIAIVQLDSVANYQGILENRGSGTSLSMGLFISGFATLTCSWTNTVSEYNNTGLAFTLGEYTFCAMTVNGTALKGYRWSPTQGWGTISISITATNQDLTAGPWRFGWDNASSGREMDGRFMTGALYDARAFTDSEIYAWCDQWRRGFPNILNWIEPRPSFGVTAAGGSTLGSYYYRQVARVGA